ncbi:outer membrane beta-barrel protein [uncultured Microscilla sp.]|uniref:outer membrane beta-barrel protein n=1 Tax=uncultured Microscilla sp. TaxID=432653 RepID=UPI0026138759|nr:outer membrane beta-barrel protein [uncultured Microscilla sp.]
MKKGLLIIALICMTATVVFSQNNDGEKGISIGLRGGITLTSGNTTFPANASQGRPVEFKNNSDGFGLGYVFGGTARINFGGLFLQSELNYGQFKLKQKNTQTYGVSGASLTNNINSVSTMDAFNIPILLGTKLGSVRVYAGPSFIFVTRAEQKTTGTVRSQIGGIDLPSISSEGTQDLLSSDAGDFEVRPFIIAVEAGVGFTLPMGLEADLRYSVPAITGVYKNKDVKGFLGILSLSVGFRLAKLGM